MRREQCDRCNRLWGVSACADTSTGYTCPDCEKNAPGSAETLTEGQRTYITIIIPDRRENCNG